MIFPTLISEFKQIWPIVHENWEQKRARFWIRLWLCYLTSLHTWKPTLLATFESLKKPRIDFDVFFHSPRFRAHWVGKRYNYTQIWSLSTKPTLDRVILNTKLNECFPDFGVSFDPQGVSESLWLTQKGPRLSYSRVRRVFSRGVSSVIPFSVWSKNLIFVFEENERTFLNEDSYRWLFKISFQFCLRDQLVRDWLSGHDVVFG